MGRLISKVEENKPIPKVYYCKNCGEEITKAEYDQNRELCSGCLNEFYSDFGGN